MEEITIVGAGPVGTLLAIFLAQAGFRVDLYDSRDDPRQVNLEIGTTINITLSARGFQALRAVGAEEIVRQHCLPVYGRSIHGVDGKLVYQSYGSSEEAVLYPIRRQVLQKVLVDLAEQYDLITFHFNEKCLDIDLSSTTITFQNTISTAIHTVQAKRVFGADGAYSTIRQKMMRQKRFKYAQTYLDHCYRELLIPACPDGGWQLCADAVHIWPRDEFMLLGLPNLDGSFALTLTLPFEGPISHTTLTTHDDYVRLFECYFADVYPYLAPTLAQDLANPVGHLLTIQCYPWIYQDTVALIGDASHAIYPFYAQGVNAGFEDCHVLSACIAQHQDWATIFQEYQAERKPNTDAIASMAADHFRVLSKLVGDPEFQLRERIEKKVESLFPERASLYHNIAFTHLPYAEAQRREQHHQQIIDKLMAVEGIATRLDEPSSDQFLRQFVASQEGIATRSDEPSSDQFLRQFVASQSERKYLYSVAPIHHTF